MVQTTRILLLYLFVLSRLSSSIDCYVLAIRIKGSLSKTRNWNLHSSGSRMKTRMGTDGTHDADTTSPNPESLILSQRDYLADDENESNKIRLVLASQSPRRREILDMMGLAGLYKVQASPLNETALQATLSKDNDPVSYCRTLAEHKADAFIAAHLSAQSTTANTTTIVLASDTIVAHSTLGILEKPQSTKEAIETLWKLQNSQHMVHTAVVLRVVGGESGIMPISSCCTSFVDTAVVKFAPLSRADIVAYVDTGEPMDKAGSYGIQGMGGQFVASVQGDFFTVMGLPMHRTSRALAKIVASIRSRQEESFTESSSPLKL